MGSVYLYYAFISYKHEDIIHAIWLQKKLQNYRLPAKLKDLSMVRGTGLNGEEKLPTHLSPIFRDQTDLIPGQLEDSIEKALASSKYLIVLCSRKAKEEPEYLDLEIRSFLESGHTVDQIIPLIVEDCEDPHLHCFPPELQKLNEEYELLAANLYDAGKNDAFLKIVANMLGVQMAEIKNLDIIRRRRQRLLACLASLVVILCGAAAGKYWWDHVAEHTFYYEGYVLEHNVAKGITPVEKSSLGDQRRYYRFRVIDQKIQSVEYLNHAGVLVPEEATILNQGASRIEYAYTEDGILYQAKLYSYRGEMLVCYQYSKDGTHVTMIQDETTGISAYAPASFEESLELFPERTFITRYVQELDPQGRITKRQFAYGEGYSYCADEDYVFGYQLEYDETGNLSGFRYLGTAQGEPTGSIGGVNGMRYDYEPGTSRLIRETCLNLAGEPVTGSEGWAYKEYTRGENQKITMVSYYGVEKQPVLCRNGYAAVRHTYEGPSVVKSEYLGLDGNLTITAYGYAMTTCVNDQAGRMIEEYYWDTQGNPTTDRESGTYGYIWEIISEREGIQTWVDAQGQPMKSLFGYAKQHVIRDEWEYPLEIKFYDEEGQPCSDRYASCTYVYDPIYHRVQEWRFFDEKGEPTIGEFRCAAVINEYNAVGGLASRSFLDEKGDLTNGVGEWAKMVTSLEQVGNETRETIRFYGEDGNPVVYQAFGAAGTTRLLDEKGRIKEVYYLNEQGERYMDPARGYAGIAFEYDEYDRACSKVHYNQYGLPVIVDGAAFTKFTHDKFGNTTSLMYYNTDMSPMVNELEGYAAIVILYDEEGNLQNAGTFGLEDGEYVLLP